MRHLGICGAMAALLAGCAAPPPPPPAAALASAAPPAMPVSERLVLPPPSEAELRALEERTRPPAPAAPGRRDLNDSLANDMVFIYRAELCGARAPAWADKARAWTRLVAGNIDLGRRGEEAWAISRGQREAQLARVAHFERLAPSFGAYCRAEATLEGILRVERGMRDLPLEALAPLEARWAAPARRAAGV